MTKVIEKEFDIFDILVGTENESDFAKKPVIIQGMTGSYGSTHTKLMKSYGTNIAAGVTPDIRDACPRETGRTCFNFCLTSEPRPITAWSPTPTRS